jgi:hypothetical protein
LCRPERRASRETKLYSRTRCDLEPTKPMRAAAVPAAVRLHEDGLVGAGSSPVSAKTAPLGGGYNS